MLASLLGATLCFVVLGAGGLIVAPFGATAVLLFGNPGSPLAQPRNVVLGSGLAALVS
ncbi:MAG: HPP family protein, partial [Cyanobacteria bacterium K_DeepCast_35m_m2_023]|nr:HPP family protein [Cyanobacteria bacterium K_DeepCast_35m_m2_023]